MTPKNPYRTALLAVGTLALTASVIFVLSGTAIANSDTAAPDAVATGAAALAIGGWLVTPGVLALLLWLVVSSLAWQAPAPSSSGVKTSSATRPDLQSIRAELDREEPS